MRKPTRSYSVICVINSYSWESENTTVFSDWSVDPQRRMMATRAMPRANPTDSANSLISGATSDMSERTFADLEQSSGLDFQGAVAVNAADVLDGPYATD